MSALSSALTAHEIWLRFTGADPATMSNEGIMAAMKLKRTIEEAAPDALAFIKEALPYLGEVRDSIEDAINLYNPEFMSEESLKAFKEELENLDALLAEAKGEKHEL